MRVPTGPFDTILVEGLAESFGNLERFARDLAAELAPDGRVIIDAESAVSARALRVAIEGRVASLEPFGSLTEPERRVPLRRLVSAFAATGLLVEDVVAVPSGNDRVGPDFVASMFAQGFLPAAWVARAPEARVWLVASNTRTKEGTVLIGPGPEQERTARAVSALLPATWEVVRCAGECESDAWNHAIPACRGELLWLLRAGAHVDGELFAGLLARTVLSPAAPGDAKALAAPGDVSGLMVARTDALVNGPFAREIGNDAIRYEDWLLRLDALGRSPHGVVGAFTTPPAAVQAPARARAEADELLLRWEPIGQKKQVFESDDDPHARARRDRVVPWAGREPRVSLVMMAKNEERFLAQCLTHAQGAYDELVVVDTGSTDRTIEIAESFGAKVVRFPWCDDFAAPRNVGLRHATGDWILVLDPDEFLHEAAAARIRELVRDPGVCGFHLAFQNVYTGGKTLGVLMVRLFRNLAGIAWQNRIHEQITPSLVAMGHAQGLILSISDVEVEHHGYSDEVMAARGKNERNERLFRLQLESMPDDVYSLYKFGDFLRRVPGRSADARDWLQKAWDRILAMPPLAATELPYASEIAALLALEYARCEQHERARTILEHALRACLATPNLHYIAAMTALADQRSDEAILHFERCLAFRDQVLVVAIQEGITSWVSIAGIAQAWLQKGERQKARRLLEQARALKPEHDVTAMTLSRMCFEEGRLGDALCALTELLQKNPKSAGAAQQATLILARMGETQRARELGRHTIKLMEEQALDHEASRMKELLVSL